MNLGGLQLPPNIDPNLALMMLNAQFAKQDKEAQREDSRHNMSTLVTILTTFADNQTKMMTSFVAALAQNQHSAPPVSSSENTAEAFVKGVEVAANLMQGANEARVPAEAQTPTWPETTKNIVDALKVVRDLSSLGTAATNAPVIPPEGTP
jgi:flagellar motor protein MotB